MAVTMASVGLSVTSKTAHMGFPDKQGIYLFLLLVATAMRYLDWYTFADPRYTKNQLYCLIWDSTRCATPFLRVERRIFSWLTRSRARSAEHSTVFHTIPAAFANLSDQQGFLGEGTHPTCKASEVIEKFCQATPSTSLHRVQAKSSFGPLMHQRNLRDKKARTFDNANYHVGNAWHLALWFNVATCRCMFERQKRSFITFTHNLPTKKSSLLPCKCFHFSSSQQVSNQIDTPFLVFCAKCPVPGFRASKMNHRSIGRAQTIE